MEERWGETTAWKQSQQRTAGFTKDDWVRIKADNNALLDALAAAKRAGVAAGSAEADERFTRCYDDVEPGLAQFLHDIVVESLDT